MMAKLRSTTGALAFVTLLATSVATQEHRPSPAATEDQLLPGVEVNGSVSSGRASTYRISLDVDEAVEVHASQTSVDLRLRLLNPLGQEVARGNLRRPQHGDERLHAVAASDGMHQLSIEVAEGAPVTDAPFTVVTAVHPAEEQDRRLSRAERAYAEADAKSGQGTGEGSRAALTLLQDALAGWRSAGASFEEATALNRIGLVHLELSALREALTAFDESLRLRREIGDQYGEGVAINNLAATYTRQGAYDKATPLYAQAVQIRRAVGDRSGLGWSLIGVGVTRTNSSVGDGWPRAVRDHQEALEIFQAIGETRGVAEANYYLGYAHKQLNAFDDALTYFEKARALREQRNDLAGQASALTQVAAIHLQLGDPQRALEIIEDTLPLRRRAGDRRGEAYTLQTAGVALTRLGDHALALERLRQALEIFDAVGDREGQTGALAHMASLRAATGDARLALELAQRALGVMNDQRNLITTILLSVTGEAQLALGLYDDAAASYGRALFESRRLGEQLPAARALVGLGRVARSQHDLAASRRHLIEALDVVESVRAAVAQSELRSSFLGLSQTAYDAAIDTLVDLHQRHPSGGYAAEALAVSERRRARTLLETLAEARADLRSNADAALLEQEDSIQQKLNRLSAQRAVADAASPPNVAAADADGEIANLVAALRSVRADIRTRSPKYAAITRPTPLQLAGVQQLLDADTLLLEYSLGENRSYLWAVTPTTMTLHELPPRAEVEKAVVRARDLITQSMRRGVRGPMHQALVDLSDMILGPVAAELANKRLVIVADAVLQFLPFAALPRRSSAAQGDADEPLIVRHEIVMLPSASTLEALREARPHRPANRQAVVVLADPVTQPSDPRLAQSAVEGIASAAPPSDRPDDGLPRDLTRAADALGFSAFARLPYSHDEAVAIAARAGKSGSLTALGFDATRELALSPTLNGFRVVHFATHTVLDARHPELSGIVLTLVDRERQRVNGFLRLHDIFNMKLSADVVVLSACQTAVGRDVRGEGLIGLTRGFMYAGAPQVVASLWDVRDRATATLMEAFYAGLLERGVTPAAALRAAQLAMWKNPRWRMPAYWAGFTVQGDWRPASF